MPQQLQTSKVVLIGAGNVGSHLAAHLIRIGIHPALIFSRSISAVSILGKELKIPFTDNIEKVPKDADIYLIAVNDDQIGNIDRLDVEGGIVAHTSGTVSKEVLSRYSGNYGVFYPLQTFRKEHPVDFSSIPILVDGNTVETKKVLATLGSLLSEKVTEVSDEDRKYIHLAAVIANNFTNHLWSISEQILKARSLDFDILVPLILKSTSQLREHLPSTLQTGPAARSDQETITRHLELLKEQPDWQDIYKLITLSILKHSS